MRGFSGEASAWDVRRKSDCLSVECPPGPSGGVNENDIVILAGGSIESSAKMHRPFYILYRLQSRI
jgi:hypothetical protein